MKKITILSLALVMCACTQTQLTEGEVAAQTAANALETVNTATGGGVTLFTQAVVDKALTSTHNSGDIAVVNAAIAEGEVALKAQLAAKTASPMTGQAITTAILTDPNTIETGAEAAAAVINPPAALPFTSTPVVQ